jgi:hypothetical protein
MGNDHVPQHALTVDGFKSRLHQGPGSFATMILKVNSHG